MRIDSPYHDYNSHKHARKDEMEHYTANEHIPFHYQTSCTSPGSTCTSKHYIKDSMDRKVTVNGRSYDCSGMRISSIMDENRFGMSSADHSVKVWRTFHWEWENLTLRPSANYLFYSFTVECLEKNRQRLHLASIALSQGLISSDEYCLKQKEFVNAFSFFWVKTKTILA